MPDYDVNIRNVTRRFGSTTAVDPINLDVPNGANPILTTDLKPRSRTRIDDLWTEVKLS
jgi:ABC-type transporter Mla maintaining outer membrane lipid asymmetry ATPase subunit MlaF